MTKPRRADGYIGWPTGTNGFKACRMTLEDLGYSYSILPARRDLVNHSPDGFSWGYLGSGCAQLALAILADATDDETALLHYQEFKKRVISKLPMREGWSLTHSEVMGHISPIEAEALK